MQAIAWNCKTDKKHEKVTYMLQVDEIKGARAKKNTFKALEGWKKFAEGFNNKNNKEVLIFTRNFDTISEWKKWAKTFPYDLKELNRNNKFKSIKRSRKRKM